MTMRACLKMLTRFQFMGINFSEQSMKGFEKCDCTFRFAQDQKN